MSPLYIAAMIHDEIIWKYMSQTVFFKFTLISLHKIILKDLESLKYNFFVHS